MRKIKITAYEPKNDKHITITDLRWSPYGELIYFRGWYMEKGIRMPLGGHKRFIGDEIDNVRFYMQGEP